MKINFQVAFLPMDHLREADDELWVEASSQVEEDLKHGHNGKNYKEDDIAVPNEDRVNIENLLQAHVTGGVVMVFVECGDHVGPK